MLNKKNKVNHNLRIIIGRNMVTRNLNSGVILQWNLNSGAILQEKNIFTMMKKSVFCASKNIPRTDRPFDLSIVGTRYVLFVHRHGLIVVKFAEKLEKY